MSTHTLTIQLQQALGHVHNHATSRAQPHNLLARSQESPMRAIKSVNVGDTGAAFTSPCFALSSHRSTMGPVRRNPANLTPTADGEGVTPPEALPTVSYNSLLVQVVPRATRTPRRYAGLN